MLTPNEAEFEKLAGGEFDIIPVCREIPGDLETPVYPRSSLKPIQTLPLVESGAAEAFGLGDEEIALACASHSSEPMHTTRVAAWLARIGILTPNGWAVSQFRTIVDGTATAGSLAFGAALNWDRLPDAPPPTT